MAPKKTKTDDTKKRKSEWLFKITVVGPEDRLLEQVLSVFNEQVVSVDGIRIGATKLEREDSDVRTLFMSPKHSALDLLLSLTYKGATGVIIVLKSPDPEIEALYRNEIRENLGEGIPTRMISVDSDIDDFKRNEIHNLLDELLEEILSSSNT